MKFSFITVTMGDRPAELQRLKDSLAQQTFRDFEHIVIDHRDHPECAGGLSKARNLGLSLAKGDVVAFPDDDAWYGPETLANAAEALSDEKIDGVSFRVLDEAGACSAGGWMSAGRKMMTRTTVWHTAVSCSFFVKRKALGDVRFDERLGVGSGTRFGSGEDTDFLLSLIERGARIRYDGSKCVFHPRTTGCMGFGRGWLYGNGYGATMRKHRYGPTRLAWGVGVQLARALQSLAAGHVRKAGFHLSMSVGRLMGCLFAMRDLPSVFAVRVARGICRRLKHLIWASFHLKYVLFPERYMTNLEAAVINACALNCRHCSHFMPEYGRSSPPSADLIISDLQKLLSAVERIDVFTLLGGEALLHPELHRIVRFLLGSDKIGRVDIQTTGTLAPPAEIIDLFPNPRLRFKIENFGRLSDKIGAFSRPNLNVEICDQGRHWNDHGDARDRGRTARELERQYAHCRLNRFSLQDGRIFVCPRAGHGEGLGYFKNDAGESVDVRTGASAEEIRAQIRHLKHLKFATACNHCDRGTPAFAEVGVAEQR